MCDGAVEFLDQRQPDDKPFLMYVSLTVPHDPWMPPEEYLKLYPKEVIPLPKNFLPRPQGKWFSDWHGTHLRDQVLQPFPRTPEGVRDVLQRYYATVTHMDHEIGRVLDELEKKNLAESTIVIFVGDQGISLGSHGFSGKQTMYEEGIRTPLIIRHPSIKRNRLTNENLVTLMDLFPTACEIASVKVPSEVEGKSLLGLYRGVGGPIRDAVFTTFISEQHRWNVRAVRTTRYKYIKHLTTDEVELFDLQSDPLEMTNLAGIAGYEQIQRSLAGRLDQWRERSGDKRNDRMLMDTSSGQ
jgi:arylsulfatase A-like enzyme